MPCRKKIARMQTKEQVIADLQQSLKVEREIITSLQGINTSLHAENTRLQDRLRELTSADPTSSGCEWRAAGGLRCCYGQLRNEQG